MPWNTASNVQRCINAAAAMSSFSTDPDQPVPTQVLWSTVFAFSCNLLLLIVYEVVGIINPR